MLFTLGDLLAGMPVGTVTALGVRALCGLEWIGCPAMLVVIVGLVVVRALQLSDNMLRDVVVEAGE